MNSLESSRDLKKQLNSSIYLFLGGRGEVNTVLVYLYSRTVGVPSLVIVSTEPFTRTRTLEGIRATRTTRTKKKKENVKYRCYYLHSQRIGPTTPHLYSSPGDKDAAFCLDRLTILYLRFGGSREEHLQRT